MEIGSWGRDLVFSTSDRRILNFQKFARSSGSDWATHSRIGKKDQAEYLRPKLQKVTFTMRLDATLGVRPRSMLDLLTIYAERGTVNILVIGGKRVGEYYWRITDLSEAWETVLNRGELVSAKVNVTMQEYL